MVGWVPQSSHELSSRYYGPRIMSVNHQNISYFPAVHGILSAKDEGLFILTFNLCIHHDGWYIDLLDLEIFIDINDIRTRDWKQRTPPIEC